MLSKGGGIYSRSVKTVPLFAEARKLLGLNADAVTPADVIRAILKANVDLLWFGGIGTYVKSSAETDAQPLADAAQVGDHVPDYPHDGEAAHHDDHDHDRSTRR